MSEPRGARPGTVPVTSAAVNAQGLTSWWLCLVVDELRAHPSAPAGAHTHLGRLVRLNLR